MSNWCKNHRSFLHSPPQNNPLGSKKVDSGVAGSSCTNNHVSEGLHWAVEKHKIHQCKGINFFLGLEGTAEVGGPWKIYSCITVCWHNAGCSPVFPHMYGELESLSEGSLAFWNSFSVNAIFEELWYIHSSLDINLWLWSKEMYHYLTQWSFLLKQMILQTGPLVTISN